jgi:hypothetical protein
MNNYGMWRHVMRIKLSELKRMIKEAIIDDELNNERDKNFNKFWKSKLAQKKLAEIIYSLIYDEGWDVTLENHLMRALNLKYTTRKSDRIVDLIRTASNERHAAEYGDKHSIDAETPSEREEAEDELEKIVNELTKLLGFDIHKLIDKID